MKSESKDINVTIKFDASIILLLKQISDKLDKILNISPDQARINALSDQVGANADELKKAVDANTPK